MSSIKLTADSGGGTFEIKAPSSSGNTRVLTLPDTGHATVLTTDTSAGKILQVVSSNYNRCSFFLPRVAVFDRCYWTFSNNYTKCMQPVVKYLVLI